MRIKYQTSWYASFFIKKIKEEYFIDININININIDIDIQTLTSTLASTCIGNAIIQLT